MTIDPVKLQDAVRDGSVQCIGHPALLACLSNHLNDLRNAGWDEADVRQVEITELKVLKGVIDPDSPDTRE